MSVQNKDRSLRVARYDGGEVVEGAICADYVGDVYSGTCNASTDPFSGKANKYAECKVLRIVIQTLGCHIRMGTSAVGTAVTSDFYIPPNVPTFIAVDDNRPYLRIIGTSGTPTYNITELR